MCERCKDPNKVDVHEYKIDPPVYPHGKVTLCDECAAITRDAGLKLTGGKAPEAEPSALSSEAAEEQPRRATRRG